MPKSMTARSYQVCLVLWESANGLPNWPYHVAFHQRKRGVPVAPHAHQLLVSVRCIWAVRTGGWWYLTPVSICISLMTLDVRHLLRCLPYISFGDACEGLWPTFGIKSFNFSEYRILGCCFFLSKHKLFHSTLFCWHGFRARYNVCLCSSTVKVVFLPLLVFFRIFSLTLIYFSLKMISPSVVWFVFVLAFILLGVLWPSQSYGLVSGINLGEIHSLHFLKYFFCSFLCFFSSGTPIMLMSHCL